MAYTLDRFAAECHALLNAAPGPVGRERVRVLLAAALNDPPFVAACLPDGAPERTVLYEDPELGFCIVGHVYRGPKDSSPHDHGPTWAIYGQARGETRMTDWDVVEPADAKRPGKVRPGRSYTLRPGMAHLYNEGDVHAPSRAGPTRLIRIEGVNTDRIQRFPYEPI